MNKTGEGVYDSNDNPVNSLLFWVGIFWRVSVSEKAVFKMQKKDEHKLWLILNFYLNKIDNEIQNSQIQGIKKNIGYKIIRSPEYIEKFKDSPFTIHTSHTQPHCILLGEFAIFLYMKSTHLNGIQQLFYSFEKNLPNTPINTLSLGEKILSINHDEFSKKIESAALHVTEIRKKGMNKFLDYLHVAWGGETKRMHQDVKAEIFAHLANSSEKLGRKYTNEDLFKSAFEVLSKYNTPID